MEFKKTHTGCLTLENPRDWETQRPTNGRAPCADNEEI